MKTTHFFALICIIWASHSHAQITIDTITTDTINIFDRASLEASTSSATAALWITAALPGAGHQILNRPKSALTYISIDLFSLFGAIALNHYATKTQQNAKAIAYQHAGVTNHAPDNYFWQIIGNFDSYKGYHEYAYPLDFRTFSDKFTGAEYQWDWVDDDTRKEFNDLRKQSKSMSTLSTFFIGAMFLNRLIAFIDLRSTVKNQRFTSTAQIHSYSPHTDRSANGLILSTTF